MIIDNMKKAGVQNTKKNERLAFNRLDHFAGEAYAGVELDVDMKLPGYEAEVIEGLLKRGLGERSLVSSPSRPERPSP